MEYSISPDGEKFRLPEEADYREEYERLAGLVTEKREAGHEIVAVMGLGFVGAVMAGVVADSVDKESQKPNKFVIGMQRLGDTFRALLSFLLVTQVLRLFLFPSDTG